jgi:hypothetical protein
VTKMLQISDEPNGEFSSTSILSFSLQSLIKSRLYQSIYAIGQATQAQSLNLESLDCPQPSSALKVIPLHLVKDMARIAYQSAIALKFANQWNLSALELAEQIVINCTSNCLSKENSHLPLERIFQHFVFQVQPFGWIEIELTDPGIAQWLQMLITNDSGLNWAELSSDQNIRQPLIGCKNDSNFFQNAISLFEIQYAHARCCTLLRFGVQADLLTWNGLPTDGLPTLLHPNPFPWLTIDQSLRLQHPVERRLIQQISRVLDHLADLPIVNSSDLLDRKSTSHLQFQADCPQNAVKTVEHRSQEILKLAQTLSQQVQVCHATCRIWEDIKRSDLALAQTRLGLNLVTQIVLNMLLDKELGVIAPIEL